MDLSEIESRYSNLKEIWGGQSSELLLFPDEQRASAFLPLSKLQRSINSEGDRFDELSSLLRRIHWDLRGWLGGWEGAQDHWNHRVEELNQKLSSVRNMLDAGQTDLALELRAQLESLAVEDSNYLQFLRELVTEREPLLVVERPFLKESVQALVAQDSAFEGTSVITLNALFSSKERHDRNVYILAAPQRISDNFMRALVLGGAISAPIFVCANWLAPSDRKPAIRQQLAPGLVDVRKPTIAVRGELASGPTPVFSYEDFEIFAEPPINAGFETYTATGPTQCRLLQIAGGYVMPVELQASRISVLTWDEEHSLKVEFRVPGSTLKEGDILFELRDGAEEDFLMDRAQERMGDSFKEFASGRLEWKSRARARIAQVGLTEVIKTLMAKGVSTAEHLNSWLENPDFTTPRANKDWRNLLAALDFAPPQIKLMEKLATDLKAALIAVGQEARHLMADAVSADDLRTIEEGGIVTKRLDEFGDAIFVLGKVLTLDSETRFCQPTEIRRVLRK